jgi:hypothetical protein
MKAAGATKKQAAQISGLFPCATVASIGVMLSRNRHGRPLNAPMNSVANSRSDARERLRLVMTKEGGLLYFHRNSVLSGVFDKLRRGGEVTYVEDMGDTGLTASKVRKVLAHALDRH